MDNLEKGVALWFEAIEAMKKGDPPPSEVEWAARRRALWVKIEAEKARPARPAPMVSLGWRRAIPAAAAAALLVVWSPWRSERIQDPLPSAPLPPASAGPRSTDVSPLPVEEVFALACQIVSDLSAMAEGPPVARAWAPPRTQTPLEELPRQWVVEPLRRQVAGAAEGAREKIQEYLAPLTAWAESPKTF